VPVQLQKIIGEEGLSSSSLFLGVGDFCVAGGGALFLVVEDRRDAASSTVPASSCLS